jgi:hypothetical protein
MMMNGATANHKDLDSMADFWHQETNYLNIKVD